jgi:hypothetical protein
MKFCRNVVFRVYISICQININNNSITTNTQHFFICCVKLLQVIRLLCRCCVDKVLFMCMLWRFTTKQQIFIIRHPKYTMKERSFCDGVFFSL